MYSFQSRVRYSECDENGRLSLVSMMNYLQDCSTFHSEELGYGVGRLKSEGLGWILAAWEIEIDRLPDFAETITTSTWSYELKRLHAQRCFQIEDAQGRPLVKADSQWFVYDLNAGKVVRVPESQKIYLTDEPRVDLPPMERRIAVEGEGRACSPIHVTEQHLDTNGHVNNAQYVLFAQAALKELGIDLELKRLCVQYRTMAWPGDTIHPVVHECENGRTVVLGDGGEGIYAVVKMQEA